MRKSILPLILFIVINSLSAQNREKFIIHIKKAENSINVDGILDEADWLIAEKTTPFFRILPIDTGYAVAPSDVVLTYNEEFLFIGITCYEGKEGDIIVESLRRDFSFGKNDNFLIFMDTYNDQTNGFSFGTSAAGAQWDGLQANGGFVNLDWDCKWVSKTIYDGNKWVVEMGIPFKSIRYKAGVDTWGINFSRLDLKLNEKTSWAPVPRQFQSANLAFAGTLQWDKPPPNPGLNVSLIPYTAVKASTNHAVNTSTDVDFDAGLDAKWAISSSLNLDVTINPDFSQVEVDRQVINLDRFELFFPERRQFFLENKDIFTDFGATGIRPFFTRRIGLQSDVGAGLKLSGKLNEAWRFGLLNMQTRNAEVAPASNFTVASIQRKVLARSNIGLIFVNKNLTVDPLDPLNEINDYNRVLGVDFNLASADNRWTGKVFAHKSFAEHSGGKDYVLAGNLLYSTGNVQVEWRQETVGADYIAEVGFIRRTGYHRFNPSFKYNFFPQSKTLNFHGPFIKTDFFYDTDFNQTDRNFDIGYAIRWLNRSHFEIQWSNQFVQLFQNFDPTNSGGETLITGSEYEWQNLEITYISDLRKTFNYSLTSSYGGFYNGNRFNLESSLIARFQPYGSLSLIFSYNNIDLPAPFNDANFVLIGPKLDITFTDKIFLTTFIQYNNQIDNINLNVRFQWRYKPVSDLFIVYTDNYFPDNLVVKNRAIVAKVSYWFN